MFNKNTKTILVALVVVLLIGAVVYALMSQNSNLENTVGNQNGEDIETPEEKRANVVNFLEDNISSLSPEEPVLGGSFYVTNMSFPADDVVIVDYEDGHIALTAQVRYSYNNEEVEIESFEIIENDVDFDEERAVINYLENNISLLSPVDTELGGSFYVTSVTFPEENTAIVDYEDGHIALSAKANYSINSDGEVEINSFDLIPEGSTIERSGAEDSDICVDMCGDGVCQEMVCMGEGCPCAESVEICPADCL
jgi:hypothetical protein